MGRRGLNAKSAPILQTLKIGEIIGEGVLLPVTIRGEVPGRAMRGSASFSD
jgi:hypothetical protein